MRTIGTSEKPPLPDLSLRIMLRILEAEGLSAIRPLEAAGMPQGLDETPSQISADQEFAFQQAFVETIGYRPDLWVRIGTRYHLPSYGPLGMALMTSPDLDALVNTSLRTGELDYSPVTISPITEHGMLAGLVLDHSDAPEALLEFSVYRDIGAFLTALHDVWVGRFPVRRIEFALPRPTWGEFTILEHGVCFDAERTAVFWDPCHSTRRLYYGDSALHSAYVEECRQRIQMSTSRDEFIDALTHSLLALDGSPLTLAHLAATIGCSERTLQRRLLDRDVRFRDLVEEARRRVATDLLTETHIPIAEIAWKLGYSEPTSFNHAFRRWTGVSPNAMRQRRRVRA